MTERLGVNTGGVYNIIKRNVFKMDGPARVDSVEIWLNIELHELEMFQLE